MRVGDLVIVASLGEIKAYRANPRTPEAEAGLKPHNVKLDLVNAIDYVEAHWKIKDIVTDEAGRFKADAGKMGGNAGERHELEKKMEEDVIKTIAQDITKMVKEYDAPRLFLAMPKTIFNRVWDRVQSPAREKLFKYVQEDLTKTNKNKLPEIFKEEGIKA